MGQSRSSDLLIDQVIDRKPSGHNERSGLICSDWRRRSLTTTLSRDKCLSKSRRVTKKQCCCVVLSPVRKPTVIHLCGPISTPTTLNTSQKVSRYPSTAGRRPAAPISDRPGRYSVPKFRRNQRHLEAEACLATLDNPAEAMNRLLNRPTAGPL
jgi:hypothetical protein